MKRDGGDDITAFTVILAIMLAFFLILAFLHENKPLKDCEAKGGEYAAFKGGSICVKDGAIIQLNN